MLTQIRESDITRITCPWWQVTHVVISHGHPEDVMMYQECGPPEIMHWMTSGNGPLSINWWRPRQNGSHFAVGPLTHWGRVTHKCVVELTIIGSDNGLSPGRRQAIIWTNAGILQIGPLGTNFCDTLIGIQKLSFKKMHLKMSSAKWCPFVSASMC